MKILVTGATGLIGRQVCLKLIEQGHEIMAVSTRPETAFRKSFTYPSEYIHWDSLDTMSTTPDAVIHLAGENIAEGRWTEKKKAAILNSRVQPTEKLIQYFESKGQWPKTFISTSAVGIYGDRNGEFLTEDSSPGKGFLPDVCKAWEAAVKPAEKQCRLVILRVGIVLDVKGGFLEKLEPLFTANLGGKVGNGKQWMSWIHVEDLVNLYLYSLNSTNLKGAYNAVAPGPVTNENFTRSYASQLGVLSIFTAPAFALKIGMGEMSQLALASQNVRSEKIQQSGFKFQFENLDESLKNLYQWKKKANQQLFYSEQWVSQPNTKVFKFFSEAQNLEKITPDFLNFKILKSSTNPIEKGTLIDYRLKIHGFPARWRTEIAEWKPDSMFIDNQLKGPYKKWHHTHTFEPLKGGTLLKDKVIYELPMGKLGLLVAGILVRKDVNKIFNYRTQVIRELDGSF